MKLRTNAPEFYNEISESIRAFTEADKIELTEEPAEIEVMRHVEDGSVYVRAVYRGAVGESREELPMQETAQERVIKRCVKLAVYFSLKKYTGRQLPWGSLTGIRPTKLAREYAGTGKVSRILLEKYDLPVEKGELLEEICSNQQEFYSPQEEEIDVYIGIPFCRTRCTYCSFSSTDSTKGEKLMTPYVEALLKEMEQTAKMLEERNRRLRCLYIGGGTPTALTEALFEQMLRSACRVFRPQKEFTVEAGRPDTVTEHKLRVMKECGVSRISINPQSMNLRTLEKIGRSHSPEDIVRCFEAARSIGFRTVNADIIAGLPEETPEMFFSTLSQVLALKAENITVHTLALKRGSLMAERGLCGSDASAVQQMVEGAQQILRPRGYRPYYLYRQKYMTGNFENIGYALPGHTGVYNIDIMEETTDIAAVGCGAVSKRILRREGRIERAFNFKSIYEYIRRIDEVQERKKALFS